jgi:hypothetical protein
MSAARILLKVLARFPARAPAREPRAIGKQWRAELLDDLHRVLMTSG